MLPDAGLVPAIGLLAQVTAGTGVSGRCPMCPGWREFKSPLGHNSPSSAHIIRTVQAALTLEITRRLLALLSRVNIFAPLTGTACAHIVVVTTSEECPSRGRRRRPTRQQQRGLTSPALTYPPFGANLASISASARLRPRQNNRCALAGGVCALAIGLWGSVARCAANAFQSRRRRGESQLPVVAGASL
jgi:hypothetical protein